MNLIWLLTLCPSVVSLVAIVFQTTSFHLMRCHFIPSNSMVRFSVVYCGTLACRSQPIQWYHISEARDYIKINSPKCLLFERNCCLADARFIVRKLRNAMINRPNCAVFDSFCCSISTTIQIEYNDTVMSNINNANRWRLLPNGFSADGKASRIHLIFFLWFDNNDSAEPIRIFAIHCVTVTAALSFGAGAAVVVVVVWWSAYWFYVVESISESRAKKFYFIVPLCCRYVCILILGSLLCRLRDFEPGSLGSSILFQATNQRPNIDAWIYEPFKQATWLNLSFIYDSFFFSLRSNSNE